MKIVLVSGGRDYSDRAAVYRTLNDLYTGGAQDIVILQGGADGADRLAMEWARSVPVPYITVMADWKGHGKSAGPIRNQQMVDLFKPRYFLPFPGGKGTRSMTRIATEAGLVMLEPIL